MTKTVAIIDKTSPKLIFLLDEILPENILSISVA